MAANDAHYARVVKALLDAKAIDLEKVAKVFETYRNEMPHDPCTRFNGQMRGYVQIFHVCCHEGEVADLDALRSATQGETSARARKR